MNSEAEQQRQPAKERWRIFCAVELPPDVRARAAEHIAALRDAAPRVRASWERVEKLHLTLKFLGEVEQGRVEALTQAAARATTGAQGFDISIEGAGAFPTRGLPRVLWLGVVDPLGGLARLQSRLEDECAVEGFAREERPFHPHLTIARLRTPEGARRLAELHRQAGFEAARFAAVELTLVRSELGPGGSRYSPISHHRLSAG
ncbi:MAG: RNA 2',3'-cyclic phosphodiesterase [Pyrinomonadaceae bacterium]